MKRITIIVKQKYLDYIAVKGGYGNTYGYGNY